MSLLEHNFIKYPASVIAVCSVVLACHTNGRPSWVRFYQEFS